MITLKMALLPHGRATLGEHPLVDGEMWTETDAGGTAQHGFRITMLDGTVVAQGSVPKDRSGHRNPLHLLKAVLDQVDLGGLGVDYVTTAFDQAPETERSVPSDAQLLAATDTVVKVIADLAKVGEFGWERIAEIEAEIANRRRKHRGV